MANASESAPWTSTLSISGLALLERLGFTPGGFVTASAVWTVGYQFGQGLRGKLGILPPSGFQKFYPCPHVRSIYRFGGGPLPAGAGKGAYGGISGRLNTPDGHEPGINWEHTNFADSVSGAFDSAHSRLLESATALGAHGIVDVRLNLDRDHNVVGLVELTLTGTAVVATGVDRLEHPFATFAPVSDVTKLLAGGWAPVGVSLGAAAIEAEPGCSIKIAQSGMRARLVQYADVIDQARAVAVERMEAAADPRAEAVVGCRVEERIEPARHSYGAEVICTGSAVRHVSGASSRFSPALQMLRLR